MMKSKLPARAPVAARSTTARPSRSPTPSGASTGSASPKRTRPAGMPDRHRTALETSVAELSRTIVKDKKLPAPRREANLIKAKLGVARALSAIHHEDMLPPEVANQVHALLIEASGAIMATAGHADMRSRDAKILHSLLLLGERDNRLRHHNGQDPASAAPLNYRAGGSGAAGTVTPNSVFPGIASMNATPDATTTVGNVAHESVHEAQHNHTAYNYWDHSALQTQRTATVDTRGHARAGLLDAAIALPNFRNIVPDGSSGPIELYTAKPTEMQAFLEQSAVHSLVAELNPGAPVISGDPGDFGPALKAGCGMELLPPLLVQAAWQLNSRNALARLSDRLTPDEYLATYDPAQHPQASEHVQQILLATSAIHHATRSAAWTDEAGATLAQAMRALDGRLRNTPGLDGTQRLAEMATTLGEFVQQLRAAEGHALQQPRGDAPTPQEFHIAKTSPEFVLRNKLAEISANAAPGQRVYADPLKLPSALKDVKADFREGVAELRRIKERRQLTPEDVQRTIMRLVAPLTGLPGAILPPEVLPAVHLYEADSMELAQEPGLNVGSHQKRKASFEPITWQLHIPLQALDDPERLEARLAGLAADVAYTMAAFMDAGPPRGNVRKTAESTGLRKAERTMTLGIVRSVLEHFRPTANEYVDAHPDSAAAALRTVIGATPRRFTDRAWHEGLRAEVKAAGMADDESTPGGDPAARAAYQARSHQRWRLPAVAFRRALAGPSAPELPDLQALHALTKEPEPAEAPRFFFGRPAQTLGPMLPLLAQAPGPDDT